LYCLNGFYPPCPAVVCLKKIGVGQLPTCA
jgi:hypothetical protein